MGGERESGPGSVGLGPPPTAVSTFGFEHECPWLTSLSLTSASFPSLSSSLPLTDMDPGWGDLLLERTDRLSVLVLLPSPS